MSCAVIRCNKTCKFNRGRFCNCFKAKHWWAKVMDKRGVRWTVGEFDVCRWKIVGNENVRR